MMAFWIPILIALPFVPALCVPVWSYITKPYSEKGDDATGW